MIILAGNLLSFDPGFGIWELVTLIIFLFVMYKYAVPFITEALDERESRIKDSLASAEKALERAEKVSKENEKALREAEVKAQEIRKQAIDEAEMLRQERIEKSKKEADRILEQARETIERDKKQALSELRKEVARLAVLSASKIIEAELDEDKNEQLVNNFIANLHKN